MNQMVKWQTAAEPEVAIDVHEEEHPQQSEQPAPPSTDTTPIVVAKEPGITQPIVCFNEEQSQQPAKTSVEEDAIQAVDVGKLPAELENIGSIDGEQELEQLAKPPAVNGIQVTPEQLIVIAVGDTDLPEKSDKSTGPSIDCDQLTPTLSPVRSDTYTDEAQKEAVKSFNDSETSIPVIVDDQVSVTEQNAALISKSVDEKLNLPPTCGEDIATVAKDVTIDKKQEAVEYPKTEDIPGDHVQSQLACESDDSAASSFDEDDQNSSIGKDSVSEPASNSVKAPDNQSNFTTVALPAPMLKKEGDNMPVESVSILDKSAPSFGKPRIKKKRSSKRKKKPRPYIELEAYQVESKESETNLSNSEDNCVTGKFDVVSFAGHGSECVLTREMEPPNGSDPAPITCRGPIWEFL